MKSGAAVAAAGKVGGEACMACLGASQKVHKAQVCGLAKQIPMIPLFWETILSLFLLFFFICKDFCARAKSKIALTK